MLEAIRIGIDEWKQSRRLNRWIRSGRPVPPPHAIKQNAVRNTAHESGARVLVETGTFQGAMIEAVKWDFDRIYSIELGHELYQQACRKFRQDSHIHLLHGDSGRELPRVLAQLDETAVFWLDAHYSRGITVRGDQDTPIWQEMQHILSAADLGHVILIDDARLFGTDPGYPKINQLQNFMLARRPGSGFVVEDDIIRISPPAETGAGDAPVVKVA